MITQCSFFEIAMSVLISFPTVSLLPLQQISHPPPLPHLTSLPLTYLSTDKIDRAHISLLLHFLIQIGFTFLKMF